MKCLLHLVSKTLLFLACFSVSALADDGYCHAHTSREETTVSCPSSDYISDFRVKHIFPLSLTFKVGEDLQAIKDAAVNEVKDLLDIEGYILRGHFGNYTLFQRKVGNVSEQENVILVKEGLRYFFIKNGGWLLESHNQDPQERNNFIEKTAVQENLLLEKIMFMESYNRYSGAEVIIYKVGG